VPLSSLKNNNSALPKASAQRSDKTFSGWDFQPRAAIEHLIPFSTPPPGSTAPLCAQDTTQPQSPQQKAKSPPALPTWLIKNDECYGMPDLESRGLKIALDKHGERVDPDTQSRMVTREEVDEIRRYVAYRFPALADAPIVETRVCQYENTSNGDFLIDRHPTLNNVWFAGGGSGHGFKHGPAVGEYITSRLLDESEPENRFLFDKKETVQRRTVY